MRNQFTKLLKKEIKAIHTKGDFGEIIKLVEARIKQSIEKQDSSNAKTELDLLEKLLKVAKLSEKEKPENNNIEARRKAREELLEKLAKQLDRMGE